MGSTRHQASDCIRDSWMSHCVHELCHSGPFGRVASDQPEILARDTVRHDEGEFRDARLCLSHNEPSFGRVATVEHDVDATGLNYRDELREIQLSGLHLFDDHGPDSKLFEPPLDLFCNALAIRLTVMNNSDVRARPLLRDMIANQLTLQVVTAAGTERVLERPISEPRVCRLGRDKNDTRVFIDLRCWNRGTGALMTDHERHTITHKFFRCCHCLWWTQLS